MITNANQYCPNWLISSKKNHKEIQKFYAYLELWYTCLKCKTLGRE